MLIPLAALLCGKQWLQRCLQCQFPLGWHPAELLHSRDSQVWAISYTCSSAILIRTTARACMGGRVYMSGGPHFHKRVPKIPWKWGPGPPFSYFACKSWGFGFGYPLCWKISRCRACHLIPLRSPALRSCMDNIYVHVRLESQCARGGIAW